MVHCARMLRDSAGSKRSKEGNVYLPESDRSVPASARRQFSSGFSTFVTSTCTPSTSRVAWISSASLRYLPGADPAERGIHISLTILYAAGRRLGS